MTFAEIIDHLLLWGWHVQERELERRHGRPYDWEESGE
jgi:hypothetical protein